VATARESKKKSQRKTCRFPKGPNRTGSSPAINVEMWEEERTNATCGGGKKGLWKKGVEEMTKRPSQNRRRDRGILFSQAGLGQALLFDLRKNEEAWGGKREGAWGGNPPRRNGLTEVNGEWPCLRNMPGWKGCSKKKGKSIFVVERMQWP